MSDCEPIKLAAFQANSAGLCVIPPAQDGSKRPKPGRSDKWQQYQYRQSTKRDLHSWYQSGTRTGIGLVCGKVSENLECLDFDSKEAWHDYCAAADNAGLGNLLRRVKEGYCEETPRGFHLLYRCSEIGGSLKLASRPDGKTLIETRGEGGYIITAPTHGPVNSDGEYVLLAGNFESIVIITPEERADLHDLARSLHLPGEGEHQQAERLNKEASVKGGRPGDEYNDTAEWTDVLAPHGWQQVHSNNETTYWRRPGKSEGVSASTNYAGSGLLYVFSTSTPLESGRCYSKFAAYTILDHGGDFSAAASALAGAGLGVQAVKEGKRMYKYCLEANSFAAAVFSLETGKHETWVKQLALDLLGGVAATAQTPFGQSLIAEATAFYESAVKSGREGADKRWGQRIRQQ